MTILCRRLLLLALLWLPALAQAGPAYVKIDSIPGTAMNQNHQGWIEVLTLQVTPLPANTTHGGAGKFQFTKKVDIASPKLFEASLKGTHLPTVVVDRGNPVEVGYYYAYKSALISSIKPAGANRETVEISYDSLDKVKSGP